MNYKLFNTPNLQECRIYSPQKRTIKLIMHNNYYFIQFPEVVFAKGKNGVRGYDNYYMPGDAYCFYFGFHIDNKIYFPPLHNITDDFSVCLPSSKHRFYRWGDDTLDDLINEFWNSEFGYYKMGKFITFNNWQNMNLEEVIKATLHCEEVKLSDLGTTKGVANNEF